MTSGAKGSRVATRSCASPAPTSCASFTARSSRSARRCRDRLVRRFAPGARRVQASQSEPKSSPAPRPVRRRRSRAVTRPPDRPRCVAGSMGPGTKLPTLGQVRFEDLRDGYEVLARGLLEGGADLLLSRRVTTCSRPRPLSRRPPRHGQVGREVPIQVQVTVELTGRMLLGTEIGAALCTLEAMKLDVIGMNCATGRSRCSSRSVTSLLSRAPDRCASQRRPALCRRRQDALRPDSGRTRRASLGVHHRARDIDRRWLLRHDARTPRGRGQSCADLVPAPRSPVHEPW